MLLCVGSFFGPGNLGWSDYKSGRCKVPIPVYILGNVNIMYPLVDVRLNNASTLLVQAPTMKANFSPIRTLPGASYARM